MKLRHACLECIIKQTCNTLALRQAEQFITDEILDEVRRQLLDVDWEQTPADLSNIAYRTVEQYFPGDLFKEAKQLQNQQALACYPQLRQILEEEENRLLTAVRIAATGNIIDLGTAMEVDIAREVRRVLHHPLPIDDTEKLRAMLAQPRKILYLADNAGEIVFDRILIEELLGHHAVTVVVRGGPVINDATLEDAQAVGLTELAPVITTGSNRIGVPWVHVSEQFRQCYQQSDLVISKGQGNFETMSERHDKDIFYILRAKCDIIAHELGVGYLDLIMKHQPPRNNYAPKFRHHKTSRPEELED
jgi:uncharacterized protein with ATP-grasp and redox domains